MSLQKLLDDGGRFAAEYGGTLANHRPMALLALHRLGSSDERLNAFAAAYSTQLEGAAPAETWPAGDAWKERFSQGDAWPAYRALFAQWLAYDGAPTMLAQVLPALMPGCAAAAFHGLIRTAYALQAEHAQELADGLALWACRYMPLGKMGSGQETDPLALLRQLEAGTSPARLIQERMRDAAASGQVNRVAARLAIDKHTPEHLARAAALAYASSGNFTALHLVTATHAMRVVAAFIDDQDAAWRWFWQAYATGVVAAALKPLPATPLLGWAQIVKAAIAAEDDHTAKLVHSSREEELAYGGDDWRAAASRAVGLSKIRASKIRSPGA